MNSVEKTWNKFVGEKPLPNPGRRTILVVNPAPRRGAKKTVAGTLPQARTSTTNKEKTTMATAKQIAARKRFAAMARSGAFKRKKRSHAKKHRNPSTTTSRPRVHVSGSHRSGYRFTVGKRSKYKGRVKSINPSRRRRTHKRRHHRNPSRGGKKILGFLDTKMLVSFALGGAGFLAGVKGLSYVAKIPGFAPKADGTPGVLAPYRGAVYLLVSLFAIAKVKNTMVRDAAIGLGVAGAYDLLATNIKALNVATLAGADYSLVGYDPMLGEDVSPMSLSNLNGQDIELLGADATMLGIDASAIY